MFDRLTDRARRVVVLAEDEARVLGHNYLAPEHLLLGLLDESDGIAGRALTMLAISYTAVRDQVEKAAGEGHQAPGSIIPWTPPAKRVLELSSREALQLGHNYIGTEHILLGLIRNDDDIAARVLITLGAELNRVRQQVIVLLHGGGPIPARTATRPPPDDWLALITAGLAKLAGRISDLERAAADADAQQGD